MIAGHHPRHQVAGVEHVLTIADVDGVGDETGLSVNEQVDGTIPLSAGLRWQRAHSLRRLCSSFLLAKVPQV